MPENLERMLPEVGRDLFDVVVIRTDFSDDESWNAAVVGELGRPWGPGGEFPARVQLVDASAWSGATAVQVLAAAVNEDLSVLFLADRETMRSPERALPALSTNWEDESELDPVYYQVLIESGAAAHLTGPASGTRPVPAKGGPRRGAGPSCARPA
ncbi:DUF6924 domain-containing protein [Streptomyces sp. NPDC057287]|uniref:DUF6924 domain-containing protein n=1 Tax=Streptomyces sp. NPDC057287 TaxID=3346086 RepID=UPI00362F8AC2